MSRGNLKKMEKFSEFFESVVSADKKANSKAEITNQKPLYNNDNLYISNNIYNNSEQPKVFPTEDYYILANEIILGSSNLYLSLYDSYIIPFTFIDFYFNQFNTKSEDKSFYLKKFVMLFRNKKDNVSNAISIFAKVYKDQAEIKNIKQSLFNSKTQGQHLHISKELIQKNIAYSKFIDMNLKTAIAETRNIIQNIQNTVSESNFKYNYIEFLSHKKSSNENKKAQDHVSVNQKKFIAPPKQTKSDKVSSITLPKIKLGKRFVTSLTHSRIDSSHFAFKFMDPDKTYVLIKKYHLIKAKFTIGFEEKRKSLFETKKSAFDLF